jgi:hypothetical protein
MPRWKHTFAYLVTGDPDPKITPAITRTDSRFIFNGTINKVNATFLVDSGCSTNVISADFVRKNNIPITKSDNLHLRFGNGNTSNSNTFATVVLNRKNYSRTIKFVVAPIFQDAIIGTPWFEDIEITHLDWQYRTFQFKDKFSKTSHDWSNIKRARIEKVIHCTINELQANTTWIASIPINEILEINEIKEEPSHRGIFNFKAQPKKPDLPSMIDQTKLEPLLQHYDSIFQEPTKLPPPRPENHKIILEPDSKLPPWRPLGHLSQYELQVLKETLTNLMDKGFIKHSSSPYGANILFAKKSDGGLRLCIDYRRLNSITVKDRTPLPNIKEMQDRLAGAKFFTKLDLRDGFYNIMIHPDDQHKTAFRTRYGHFEFLVLPFGLCNAPATFTRMMNRIFGHLYDSCIIAYVDDVLIYSNTEDDHLAHLQLVFELLQTNTLFLKLSKCEIAKESVNYCGTKVSQEGIHLAQDKLESLFNTPVPTNIKQMQSFLGICNWFRDFIPAFSLVATPLTELTKKVTPWSWTPREHNAVMLLLHRIASAPCLRFFDQDRETHIYTDASLFGLGGWLGQVYEDGVHPVMFWSRKLLPAEVNYHTHERELLALVDFTKKCRHYILGMPEVISQTDHKALIYLQNQPKLSIRQANWVEWLQQFNIKIEYLPGLYNFLADHLSRNPEFTPTCPRCQETFTLSREVKPIEINQSEEIVPFNTKKIANEIKKVRFLDQDRETLTLSKEVKPIEVNQSEVIVPFDTKKIAIEIKKEFPDCAGQPDKLERHWTFTEGLLYYLGKLFIPTPVRIDLLHDHHSVAQAGHLGFQKTLNRLLPLYYWPTMRKDCYNFVKICDPCQRSKKSNQPTRTILKPLPVPIERFHTVQMDFFPTPRDSAGYNSVMIIVDKLTKFIDLQPCKTTSTAAAIATIFYKSWLCRGFPAPKVIVSDRDPRFISKFWGEITSAMDTRLAMSTARHQQTNGLGEQVVRRVKDCFRALGRPKNWRNDLAAIAFALNSAIHSSTGFTPNSLVYGYSPEDINPFQPFASDLDLLHDAIQNALARVGRTEITYNKHAQAHEGLEVGDYVLLDRTGLNWPEDQNKPSLLLPPKIGPFRIVAKHPTENYELVLPNSWKVHPIFAR